MKRTYFIVKHEDRDGIYWMAKFKPGNKVKILSKSISSSLYKNFWPDMTGYVQEVRYDGMSHSYGSDLYYAINVYMDRGGAYHFLEKDLRFPHEEDIMKELEFDEFKI